MDGRDISEGPAAREAVTWMGTRYEVVLPAAASGGAVGIFASRVPAGEGPPLHVHRDADEVIHVLEGEVEFWLDGVRSHAGPGAAVFLPRAVPHCFRVTGSGPARLLAILTPGGFEAFFPEAAARNLKVPQDMPALAELAGGLGLDFLGPPPF
jgi:uncharacterized cupin superfamily protein